jgi:hypothetical protein
MLRLIIRFPTYFSRPFYPDYSPDNFRQAVPSILPGFQHLRRCPQRHIIGIGWVNDQRDTSVGNLSSDRLILGHHLQETPDFYQEMWQTQICSLFLGGNSGLLPWNILKIGPSSSGSLGATATQKAPIDPDFRPVFGTGSHGNTVENR